MAATPHTDPQKCPELSVVIPVYNGGDFFKAAIESLLCQTLSRDRFEIILVDDGSSDGSEQYCDQLAEMHPGFVRVFHQENSGSPAGPRNTGARMARGEYLFFVDADDLVPADSFENMLRHAREKQLDIGLFKVDASSWGLTYGGLFDYPQDNCTVSNSRIMNSLGPYKLFKRSIIIDNDITFPEGILYEDLPFVLECYLHANRISVITDRVYYAYRAREDGGSISQGVGAKRLDEQVEGVDHYFKVAAKYASPQECPHIYLRGYRYLDYALPHIAKQGRTDLFDQAAAVARRHYCDQVRSLMPFSSMARTDVLVAENLSLLASMVTQQPLWSFNKDASDESASISYELRALDANGAYPQEAGYVGTLPADFGWGRPQMEKPQIAHNLVTQASFFSDKLHFGGRLQILQATGGVSHEACLRTSEGTSLPASTQLVSSTHLFGDVWHLVLEWKAVVPLSSLESTNVPAGSETAAPSPCAPAKKIIHFYLDLAFENGLKVESRFGKDRIAGVFGSFASQAALSGSWLFAPTETPSKNLSVNAVPLELAQLIRLSAGLAKRTRATMLEITGTLSFDNYPKTVLSLELSDEKGKVVRSLVLEKGARRGDRAFSGSADISMLPKGRYTLSLSAQVMQGCLELRAVDPEASPQALKRLTRSYALERGPEGLALIVS